MRNPSECTQQKRFVESEHSWATVLANVAVVEVDLLEVLNDTGGQSLLTALQDVQKEKGEKSQSRSSCPRCSSKTPRRNRGRKMEIET